MEPSFKLNPRGEGQSSGLNRLIGADLECFAKGTKYSSKCEKVMCGTTVSPISHPEVLKDERDMWGKGHLIKGL